MSSSAFTLKAASSEPPALSFSAATRPAGSTRDEIEGFNQQTDRHVDPHIHHLSEGGSTVQLDPSANSLLTRKLEHGVH